MAAVMGALAIAAAGTAARGEGGGQEPAAGGGGQPPDEPPLPSWWNRPTDISRKLWVDALFCSKRGAFARSPRVPQLLAPARTAP